MPSFAYYNPDRAAFEPSLPLVSVLAAVCVYTTLHTNGARNMDKLEFYFIRLDPNRARTL